MGKNVAKLSFDWESVNSKLYLLKSRNKCFKPLSHHVHASWKRQMTVWSTVMLFLFDTDLTCLKSCLSSTEICVNVSWPKVSKFKLHHSLHGKEFDCVYEGLWINKSASKRTGSLSAPNVNSMCNNQPWKKSAVGSRPGFILTLQDLRLLDSVLGSVKR